MIRGTVAKTYTRDWQGDDGKVILHSFQLQGDNRYFRTGTDRLVAEGDYITFDIEGNNNVVGHTLEKGKAQPPQTAPRASAPASGGYGRGNWNKGGGGGNAAASKPKSTENWDARAKYWDDKEKRDIEVVEPRITFSSAQSCAIEVVKAALEKDILAFGNASKGAKLGMLLDYVDEVTARFYNQRMNVGAALENIAATDEAGDGAEAPEADDNE